jgi:hypothetical protein
MNVHIGLPDWVAEKTRELLIFEENAKGSRYRPEWWREYLSQWFDVELVGHTTDHNPNFPKPVFWCWKR